MEIMQHHEPAKTPEMTGSAPRIEAVAWGLFFIWVGLVWLTRLDPGIGLIGVGVITLGAQATRRYLGLPIEGFWIVVGSLFLIGGIWGWLQVGVPLAPLLLILAGLVVVLSGFRARSRSKAS